MKLSLRVLLGVSYLAFCGAWWTQAGVSNDERLTGYVHDTTVNPFIVTGDGKELGDPMPVYWDGVWHLYALSVDLRAVPHFTSTDLVKWVEHEPAMVGKDIATGTVLRHENKYYLFYTDSGPQTIRLVISDNPWEFDFSKSRLVAEADDKTYRKGWFRDAYVFYNEEDKLWWMLFEGRCPEVCVGLFKSKDLLQWMQCEPIFNDKARVYGSCPQIFKHGKLWYLACQDWYNWYYTADSPMGSWTNRGSYLGIAIEAASRFTTDGKRQITWGWLANFEQTKDVPAPASVYPPTMRLLNYGGPLCIGREMVFKKDGSMGVRPFQELLTAIRKTKNDIDLPACARALEGEWKIKNGGRTLQCVSETGGVLLLDLAWKNPDYYFEAEMELDKPQTSAGIVVRSSDRVDRGYGFVLSPADKKIAIRGFNYSSDHKILNDKKYAFPGKNRVKIQIFVCDNNMEAFVDGQECLSARTADRSCYKVAIELAGGSGMIRKPILHYFKKENMIAEASRQTPPVQAGFFTPSRKGQIWDTWMYYHEGKYYMYYLAGPFGHWDGHELATSDDGVHWKEFGVMVKPGAGVTWMGTGHIWKAPDFAKSHTWVINYSEHIGDKQDIRFVTSTDLLHWTKVDDKHHFVQDVRWYHEKGRWDCIDTLQRPDGSLYGYFTADPNLAKVSYKPCGFGFAESKDGLTWTALPPVEGDIAGEFGGIQQIGDKYFILISEGRVAVGEKPEGPFHAQKKNPNAFGNGCDIYFPRFFHNAPGGPLVNHFYNQGFQESAAVYAAPLKAIEVDREGILRLKWWKNNDKLKAKPVGTRLVAAGKEYASSFRILDARLDLRRTHVIEGTLEKVPLTAMGDGPGIYFDLGNGQGRCLRMAREAVQFGEIKADGSGFKVLQTSTRDLDLGPVLKFRVVMKGDMMELYVNDYLMNLKRMNCNGQIGFIGADNTTAFKNIKVWQSN